MSSKRKRQRLQRFAVGLLVFFDWESARRMLSRLQVAVRSGGVAAVNVLVEGTTYPDMFAAQAHCLLGKDELRRSFAAWHVRESEFRQFAVPDGRVKPFVTLVVEKP
jgi:tellurite methyltransferase